MRNLLYLGVALAVLLFATGCDKFSWRESYRYDKDQPYDLYAIYELLEAREAGLIYNKDTLGILLADSIQGSNYVYAGLNAYLEEADVTGLLNYAEHGNSVFLFTKYIPEDLSYHLFGPDCFYYTTSGYYDDVDYHYEDTINVRFTQPDLLPDTSFTASFVYNFEPVNHGWTYVDSARICDLEYGIEVLSVIDTGHVNFLRLGWGNGYLYLCTSPELITNYYLSDSSRLHFAQAVFSYLEPGPVFWDEYARTYRPPASSNPNSPNYNPNGGKQFLTDNHALRYVLEQPMLSFAWYLFVIGGVLYLLFRSKRKQRAIAVINPPENSSLQYVETLARLSHQHGNHRRLALREIKMLRHHLNERFKVRWAEGKPPPTTLAERTGLTPETINRALYHIQKIEKADWLEPKDLIAFHQAIQPLYRL